MKTSHSLPRVRTLAVLACVAGAVPVAAAATTATASTASAAKTCTPPKFPASGYFTSLKVTNVSCNAGRTVTKHHYKCRTKHGIAGRCTSKVDGYTCKETNRQVVPQVEIDARVTCKKGSKKVVYTYQANY